MIEPVSLAEYLLLAIASIFWPLLFAIVLVALRTPHPVRPLSAFLAAGLLTTISVGVALVFRFQDVDAFSASSSTGRPAVYFAAGALSIIAALVVSRRPPKPPSDDRKLAHYVSSLPLAFGAGIVLNLFPGFFPFVALMDIAQTSYSDATKIALVAVFYVIMFASVEVPIVAYGIAPDRTAAAVAGFNNWLNRNGRRVAVWVLLVIGVYLLVRGALAL
jgi:hypothetical protein